MGPSDGLGIAWGAFAASLGALVTSRGVLGGSLRGPWGSWSCSCEALGGRQGILGGILGVLVRSLGVPGGPRRLLGRLGGRPGAPYAMHTDVSAFHIVPC